VTLLLDAVGEEKGKGGFQGRGGKDGGRDRNGRVP
jgi:hypothetical protein